VVTIRRPSRMITAVRVYVRAGSRYDGQRSGKAHFVEHMLFAGTANRSSHQLYSDIESLGGMIQANTTKEYATFCAVVMDRYLETGLDVLADLIINPVFDPVTFLKEKLVIMEEIKQVQDTQSVLWDRFAEALWVENPIRRPTLGNIESVRDLEYRETLGFYRERYTARNMVVSICGNMDHTHVVEQISGRFSRLQSGDELRPLPAVEPPPSKKIAHIEKDIHQTHLIIGVQATDMRDENRYAVKLIDRILGSGGSSRLSQRLREDEKCVYTVYSVAAMYEDTGCFAVCTACSPENVPLVESLVLEEWEKLKAEPVTDAELEAAKRIYEGTLARQCETNLYVAAIFGIEALLHKIEPFAESIEKIKAVTKQNIVEAANRYLNTSEYTMVTVGRKK
jgi:predicted Zn-dependent peptidase